MEQLGRLVDQGFNAWVAAAPDREEKSARRALIARRRYYLAGAHDTPVEILEALQHSPNVGVLLNLISNPSTPTQVCLAIMDKAGIINRVDARVRMVARPDAPASLIDEAANSSDFDALAAVARNPHSPRWLFQKLDHMASEAQAVLDSYPRPAKIASSSSPEEIAQMRAWQKAYTVALYSNLTLGKMFYCHLPFAETVEEALHLIPSHADPVLAGRTAKSSNWAQIINRPDCDFETLTRVSQQQGDMRLLHYLYADLSRYYRRRKDPGVKRDIISKDVREDVFYGRIPTPTVRAITAQTVFLKLDDFQREVCKMIDRIYEAGGEEAVVTAVNEMASLHHQRARGISHNGEPESEHSKVLPPSDLPKHVDVFLRHATPGTARIFGVFSLENVLTWATNAKAEAASDPENTKQHAYNVGLAHGWLMTALKQEEGQRQLHAFVEERHPELAGMPEEWIAEILF